MCWPARSSASRLCNAGFARSLGRSLTNSQAHWKRVRERVCERAKKKEKKETNNRRSRARERREQRGLGDIRSGESKRESDLTSKLPETLRFLDVLYHSGDFSTQYTKVKEKLKEKEKGENSRSVENKEG